MKKVFILVTILLICTSFIIGCTNNQATTTPASTTPPPTSTTPAPTSTTPTPASTTTKPVTPTQTATSQLPTATSAVKTGGTLKMVIIAGPQTAGGWPVDIFGPDATSFQFCIEPLLHGNSKGEVIPWLAESYKGRMTFADYITWRKGVKFHDGTDFNAKAAKFNLDQQIAFKKRPFWASVDVIDDYTVKVNLPTNTNVNTCRYPYGITSLEKNSYWMSNWL
jgi:ABC-type transport system substrate-binding protein